MLSIMKFAELQELKSKGFTKSQVARKIGSSRETVRKYWNMSEEDYKEYLRLTAQKSHKPDAYRNKILCDLKEHPDASTAQLYDWIMEDEGVTRLDFTERTMRNYVNHLRKEENIPKPANFRQYEASDEWEIGSQAQVDMGFTRQATLDGHRVKLTCFCMILCHSRYKFVKWIDVPLTTEIFVQLHNEAFSFFGGRPKEIVYDQDAVLAVCENHGDVIYTEGFKNYVDEMKYEVYLCRPGDPESKGLVENVVKYVKNNFAKHRIYTTLEAFNADCFSWLVRTGNGKVHQTTKKVPAEVFKLEKEYLTPVPDVIRSNPSNEPTISYPIRKDNVVVWKGNRYRVPVGTYRPEKRVYMIPDGDFVIIQDMITGEEYARHHISLEKGVIVGERSHNRTDKSQKVKMLEKEVRDLFGNSEDIILYTDKIHQIKSRYYRDQLFILKKLFDTYSPELLKEALSYCIARDIYSVTELRSSAIYFKESRKKEEEASLDAAELDLPEHLKDNAPETRDLSVYEELFK